MKGFKNVRAYIYEKGIIKTNVGIKNGKIAYIGNDDVIDEEFILPDSSILLPGFIDEHIHGAGGADVMDGKISSINKISEIITEEGVTSFLPTTMTDSITKINAALYSVKKFTDKYTGRGAEVLGVHLEGPFISEKYCGAQKRKRILSPDLTTLNDILNQYGDTVKIITLAIENEGADKLVEFLAGKNITVSVGHSAADFDTVKKFIGLGLRCVTHVFNAQSPFLHRSPGVVGAALNFDELCCELIADMIHVESPAIKILTKCKPRSNIILISDGMRAKYLSDGTYDLGGNRVFVKKDKAVLKNGKLAGSVLKINEAIKNLVTECEVPFETAIDYATVNPAKNIKVFESVGSISIGKNADFAVMNDDFSIALTVKKGNIVYKNKNA